MVDETAGMSPHEREAFYAERRVAGKIYAERSVPVARPGSRDLGQPMRYVHQVLDLGSEAEYDESTQTLVLRESPKRRHQLRALIVRDEGRVREVILHKVIPRAGKPPSIKPLAVFKDEEVSELRAFLKAMDHVPAQGPGGVRWHLDLIEAVFADPDSYPAIYREDPSAFQRLIASDVTARDVIAVAHRREQLEEFENLLGDDQYFDGEAERAGGPERVWQRFFERNPWIFGCSLTRQLLTSWDPKRLEQVVSGNAVGETEKRIDALMRTNGAIRSAVFAEIKHHRTDLLHQVAKPYRSGCWAVSADLAGAVAQVQGSVALAAQTFGERLDRLEDDGMLDPTDPTFVHEPRSYLVVGRLNEFTDVEGRYNQAKLRSFELFRRNLHQPEIITFDELLERARWSVGD